jgi:single-strand DNA-binding protein
MATNINRVVLTGNLTQDPELRSTQDGTAVCNLRVASNTRRKDASSGEWADKPNYFDVVVWGAQGENVARYLTKGRAIAIDGRLDWREYDARDGSSARPCRSLPTPCSSSPAPSAPPTTTSPRRRAPTP